MRVLCLHIEHFAVAVETKLHPELAGKPVVIGGAAHERRPVFDCSAEAAALGIKPGLPLGEAHHLCPDAVFLPLDEPKYAQALEEVLVMVDQFSPAVESDAPGRAFMDAAGLGKRFGSEERLAGNVLSEVSSKTGFRARVGVGNGKFVAHVAARLCPPGESVVVIEGGERDFLAAVPAELLPVSEETKGRLKLLGLDTLGQLSSLPPDALASQFGQEGLLAYELACGIDRRPVVPRPRPALLEDELTIENPLEAAGAVTAALSGLLDRLLPGLQARGQVCGKLRLRLDMDGQGTWQESLSLKTPTSSKQQILARIGHRLETVCFPGGISGVHLTLTELGPESASQASLTGRRAGTQKDIGRVARQLQARLGSSPLKKVVAVDPCSRIPERRAALVDFPETDE